MGKILDDHGKLSIEKRRESFIIHATYGLRPTTAARKTLQPGDWFLFNRKPTRVSYIDQAYVHTEPPVPGSFREVLPRDLELVILCDNQGQPIDWEDDEKSGSFGKIWREGHPEFELEDLDDLIAALNELKELL